MTNRLDFAMLHRPGKRHAGRNTVMKAERRTVDFVVDGLSLFAATGAGEFDMCGCLSPDYAGANERARDENDRIAKIYTFQSPPEIKQDRVALFVCPECGDLACGAITFRLSRTGDAARWSDFAYENGYDETQTDFDSYSAIGPFEFAIDAYRTMIMSAASAQPTVSR